MGRRGVFLGVSYAPTAGAVSKRNPILEFISIFAQTLDAELPNLTW